MQLARRLLLPVLGLSLILARPVLPVDCVDYAEYPRWITGGDIQGSGEARDVAVVGDYAYIVEDAGAALHVVDISDLLNPVLLGSVGLTAGARAVTVEGDYAYVADGYGDLIVVVDISVPMNPSIVGSIDTIYTSWDVAVAGGYAYVADAVDFKVVDVMTPANPVVVASVNTQPSNAYAVALQGDYAYLAVASGIRIIDISNPLNPFIAGSLDIPHGVHYSIAVRGDRAYLGVNGAGTSGGRRIVNVSVPTAPVLMSSVGESGGGFGVAVEGDYAYFSAGNLRGVDVYNIADPYSPELLTTLYTTPHTYGLVVRGDRLFVANAEAGVRVADLSGVPNVSVVGRLEAGVSGSLALVHPYAYLTTPDGLNVVDLTDPAAPFVAGSLTGSGGVYDVAAAGDHAYLSGDALRVVDASTPSNPAVVGTAPVPGGKGVATAGDFVYVASDYALVIVDVATPASPVVVAQAYLALTGVDVAVRDNVAYVVENDILPPYDHGVLEIFDVTNPASPTWLAYQQLPWPVAAVQATSDYVYVAGYREVAILDGTTVVSTVPTLYDPQNVAIAGDYLYIADGRAGLLVVDISTPEDPAFVGRVGVPYDARDISAHDGLVYVADQYGLQIVPAQCPATSAVMPADAAPVTALLSVHPNPVRSSTVIEWSGSGERARINLYGPLGRLVASRSMPAEGRLSWSDLVGRSEVATGVYFLELRAPGRRQTARLTAIR